MPLIKSDTQAALYGFSENVGCTYLFHLGRCFSWIVVSNVAVCAKRLQIAIGAVVFTVIHVMNLKNANLFVEAFLAAQLPHSFYRYGISSYSVSRYRAKGSLEYSRTLTAAKSLLFLCFILAVNSVTFKPFPAQGAMYIKAAGRRAELDERGVPFCEPAIPDELFPASLACASYFATIMATFTRAKYLSLVPRLIAATELFTAPWAYIRNSFDCHWRILQNASY